MPRYFRFLTHRESHRFGFTSRWSVGPEDKSPFSRRFSIHGFTQISVRPRIRGPRRSRRLRRFFTLPPVPLIGVYVWVGVKGVYKNFCIYIVRKR